MRDAGVAGSLPATTPVLLLLGLVAVGAAAWMRRESYDMPHDTPHEAAASSSNKPEQTRTSPMRFIGRASAGLNPKVAVWPCSLAVISLTCLSSDRYPPA
jgi:hypothetical protein